jgi:hypothetical protein
MKRKITHSDQYVASTNGSGQNNHITPQTNKNLPSNTEISHPPIQNSAENAADGDVFKLTRNQRKPHPPAQKAPGNQYDLRKEYINSSMSSAIYAKATNAGKTYLNVKTPYVRNISA